jgi:transposase
MNSNSEAFLPPYSPQLNPDETVWAHVKREVGKKTVGSLEEMKAHALNALRRLQKMPGLLKSFFDQPEVQYTRM